MKQVCLKKLEDVTAEDVAALNERGNYVSVFTPRGAVRDVYMQFKYVDVNGKWELVPDKLVMNANGRNEPLSNELAKVFDPERYAQRMERKAQYQAEQKARRDEIKAARAAQPKMSFEEKFGGEHSEGYMGATRWDGNNSHKYLGDAELAAAIREDLKEYMGMPKSHIKVSKESYSMGRHIYVTLKLDYNKHVLNENERLYDYKGELQVNHYYLEKLEGLLSGEAIGLLKRARRIVDSYNYDDSNSMVDYFNTNFYYDIRIEWLNLPEAA